jgi:hypothetical protein
VRGGALPPALLLAALGLALGFVPRALLLSSFIALATGFAGPWLLRIPGSWLEGVYLVFWASVVLTAASVHFVRQLDCAWVRIALSLNAGIWSSAVVRLSGSGLDLLIAVPCVLAFYPASWAVRQGAAVWIKVVASWIIAIAALAATLQLLAVTPGYLPDHME